MKTIGLIGGMSWESTVTYYQWLNRLAREKLGGLHSAKLLLWSFDFADIAAHQAKGDWESATGDMVNAARNLEKGGAQCIVICTNTMHKLAEAVQNEVDLPLIHIADATAAAIHLSSSTAPLLLATRYTMEQDFYRGRLQTEHGISTRIPDEPDRTSVHETIYNELCRGRILPESKIRLMDIVKQSVKQGADSVILGCTEIGLLVSRDDFDIPVFDTTELHARAAFDFSLR